MKRRIVPLVLDANPLLVFFYKQPGWQYVERLLEQAVSEGMPHLVSSINLGEVYYSVLRDHGFEPAQKALAGIRQGPMEIIVPNIEQTLVAARFKAGGGISYADCFAGALALERNIPVLTGDPEFERLKAYGVTIEGLLN